MGELYSIGHSRHEFKLFLSLLKKYNIDYLIDVRSVPYSKFAEAYNRENLRKLLGENGIEYYYMGKRFGARREDKSLYTEENYLDFEKVRKDKSFLDGIKNVKRVLDENYNIVLMCTEKDPMDCHRAIMVSKGFFDAGVEVKHILSDGEIINQRDIEKKMLEDYYPDRKQVSWFEDRNCTDKEYTEDCYRKRNQKIGYSADEHKE